MQSLTIFISIGFFLMNFFPTVLNYCGAKTQNATTDFYPVESVIYNGSISECGCDSENVCIRKCCDLSYILNNQTCVFGNSSGFKKPPVYKNGDPIREESINIRFVPGMVKCINEGRENFKQFLPDRNPEDEGNVQSDGKLWMSAANIFLGHDDYCLDYSEEFGLIYSVCINNTMPDLTVSDHLYVIGMMISLPFFLITFIVYALLPERNLHSMSLMCHVFAIFVAYFLASSLVFNRGKWSIVACRAMIMTILCCFMASIFWVNLMAFDICSTFSGSRAHSPNRKREERRRFLIYNIYAWGVPLAFISLIFILSNAVKPNTWYDPGIRGTQCVINDGFPTLLYYYGPLAILIVSNIIMFIITACRIRKAQKDTAVLTRRGSKKHGPKDSDKQMFQLYIRLLFAMGVNWSIEILAWFINWQVENVPPAVWYVSEFCNAAYGVAVFFLFVCKKNIWRDLKKRYHRTVGREQTELTVTTSSLAT